MCKNFKGKSIILGVPNHFGLPECFRKNLEYLGFTVYLIPHDENVKRQLSWQDTVVHGVKKICFNNRLYKPEKIAILQKSMQLPLIETWGNVDYALIIRPDLFSEAVLKMVKDKSGFFIGYQWDGMRRFPLAEKRIPYFDKFYVFDKQDVHRFSNVFHTTNFYFDYLSMPNATQQDVFFIGTFMKDRMAILAKLSQTFEALGISQNMTVVCHNKKKIKPYESLLIHFEKSGQAFEQSIKTSMASNILIDVENTKHQGLSFRCFEAIGYSKKLITNNPLVKKYDFYNENNVLVLDDNWQSSDVAQFIKKPYIAHPDIESYYSFSNWIYRIIDKR